MATGDYRHIVTFQKRAISMDGEGNEVEMWQNYYRCHAYVNGNQRASTPTSETYGGDIKRENVLDTVLFCVRYCRKVAEINPYDYQIVFNGRQYELKSLADDVKYLHNEVRFRAVARDG